jgi:hypothetical protein
MCAWLTPQLAQSNGLDAFTLILGLLGDPGQFKVSLSQAISRVLSGIIIFTEFCLCLSDISQFLESYDNGLFQGAVTPDQLTNLVR